MKSQIICLHSHKVSRVCKATETGSRKGCRGWGKEELRGGKPGRSKSGKGEKRRETRRRR